MQRPSSRMQGSSSDGTTQHQQQNRTWWSTVESLTDREATTSATVSYWPSVLLVPTLSMDRWTLHTLSQHGVGDTEEVA